MEEFNGEQNDEVLFQLRCRDKSESEDLPQLWCRAANQVGPCTRNMDKIRKGVEGSLSSFLPSAVFLLNSFDSSLGVKRKRDTIEQNFLANDQRSLTPYKTQLPSNATSTDQS